MKNLKCSICLKTMYFLWFLFDLIKKDFIKIRHCENI